jgi:hypothetical protein
MRLLVYFLAFIPFLAFGSEPDPCRVDYKNSDCHFKMRTALYAQHNSDGTKGRAEYFTYVNNYYKKYGIEGFLYVPERRGSLFEDTFANSENESLKLKLIQDFPKGRVVGGKNIFGLLLSKNYVVSKTDLKNYIFGLNVLFPQGENENLKKTQEQFGFPWEDPLFINGYLDNMKKIVIEIDRKNEFFKRSEYLQEKEEIQKFIDRVSPFAKVAEEVCGYTKIEEIEAAKLKYKDIFSSSPKNVIGCLLKKEKCELASSLINSGDYPVDRLSEYFDTIIHLKNSKACVESMKIVYLSMLRNGNPITSNPKYLDVIDLKDINNYFQKYPFNDQALCDSDIRIQRNNLYDFTESLKKIIERQAHDLIDSILVEKDPAIKDALISQFHDLAKLDVDLSGIDPATDKSILHKIADASDQYFFNKIIEMNQGLYRFGLGALNKNGLNPMHYAISSGDINKLKFAQSLYMAHRFDAGDMFDIKLRLKKLKTKDPAVKEVIEQFKSKVKIDLSHEY